MPNCRHLCFLTIFLIFKPFLSHVKGKRDNDSPLLLNIKTLLQEEREEDQMF